MRSIVLSGKLEALLHELYFVGFELEGNALKTHLALDNSSFAVNPGGHCFGSLSESQTWVDGNCDKVP